MYEISPFFVLTLSQHQFLLRLLATTKVADHNLTALCRCQRSPDVHTPYPQPEYAPYGEHNVASCRVVRNSTYCSHVGSSLTSSFVFGCPMCSFVPIAEVQQFRRYGTGELIPTKPTFQVHESLLLYPVISAQLFLDTQKQYEPLILYFLPKSTPFSTSVINNFLK
jgi:hypothetical protein